MMSNNIIWIAGAKGSLGQALRAKFKKPANTVLVSDTDVDITDLEAVLSYANINSPEWIINCAGITNPEECESDMTNAFKVNALGARNLAIAARQLNAVIIQISTDDVFSGRNGGILTEFDRPDPVSVYGKSKLAGEEFVTSLNPKHIVVRSSWVYGYKNDDFVSKVIEIAGKQSVIKMPVDYIGSPTSADVLADFVEHLVNVEEYGIFHASCEGTCSRADFAREVLKNAGITDCEIEEVYCGDSRKSYRPQNINLENLMMKMTGIYEMPKWKDALAAYMNNPSGFMNDRKVD